MSPILSVSHQPDGSFHSDQESAALSEPVPSVIGGPAVMSSPQHVAPRKGALVSRHENSIKAFIHIPIVVDSVSSQQPGMPSPSASVSSLTIVWMLLSCHSIWRSLLPETSQASVNGASLPAEAGSQQHSCQGSLHCHSKYSSMFQLSPICLPEAPRPHHSHSFRQVSRCPKPSSRAHLYSSKPRPTATICNTTAGSAAAHRMSNLDQVHKLLEGSYINVLQPQDTEKFRTSLKEDQ